MKAIYPALPLVLVLAACSSTPPPTVPTPVPTPTARPTTVPLPPRVVGDWRDAPITPGDWSWVLDPNTSVHDISSERIRSIAVFGTSRTNEVASLICDRTSRRIEVSVVPASPAAAQVATPIRVVTTSGIRALMSDPAKSTGGWLVVTLQPTDPLLDAMAFSRGRFAIEVQGRPTLYLPSWPEISRVIEDCR